MRRSRSERDEHIRVDRELAAGRQPLLVPQIALDLLAEFVDSLARAGLIHLRDAEAVRRRLGTDE